MRSEFGTGPSWTSPNRAIFSGVADELEMCKPLTVDASVKDCDNSVNKRDASERDTLCRMTVADLMPIIWKFAIALGIAVPVLTAIGTWIIARFTRAFDAYAGERAKLQTQFDNVERLVRHTEALTVTAESIKAKVSGEEWGRQQRWSKRLEIYVEMINALDEYSGRTVLVEVTGKHLRDGFDAASEEMKIHLHEQYQAAMRPFIEAQDRYGHALNLAKLACSVEAVQALLTFAMPDFDWQSTSEVFADARTLARGAMSQFITAARKDLGYEALLASRNNR